MAAIEFDEFDDELQHMEEIMERAKISLTDEDLNAPIQTLPLKKAVVVEPGTSLQTCIDIMLNRQIVCLLVLKNKELIGILTERDLLLKVAGENLNLAKLHIDSFMTTNPQYLSLNDSLVSALRLMQKSGFRHIAVVDDERVPVAVVSVKDIIQYIVEFFPQEILNLPPHPLHFGTRDREGG